MAALEWELGCGMSRLGQPIGLGEEGKMQGLSCELVEAGSSSILLMCVPLARGRKNWHTVHPHEMTQVISSHTRPVVVGDRGRDTSKA